ncbi:hypothetical protein [Deinococcus pimensis]|nr:hypothetical protein [Deinococcus pimensis]
MTNEDRRTDTEDRETEPHAANVPAEPTSPPAETPTGEPREDDGGLIYEE